MSMDKFLEVGRSSHMTRAFKMLAVAAEQPFPKIAAGAWGRFFPAPGGGPRWGGGLGSGAAGKAPSHHRGALGKLCGKPFASVGSCEYGAEYGDKSSIGTINR